MPHLMAREIDRSRNPPRTNDRTSFRRDSGRTGLVSYQASNLSAYADSRKK